MIYIYIYIEIDVYVIYVGAACLKSLNANRNHATPHGTFTGGRADESPKAASTSGLVEPMKEMEASQCHTNKQKSIPHQVRTRNTTPATRNTTSALCHELRGHEFEIALNAIQISHILSGRTLTATKGS